MRTILTWISFIGLWLLSLSLTGCDRLLYGEKTAYSGGYSERDFRRITNGMSRSQVTELIGIPLWQTNEPWTEVWSYMPRSKPLNGSERSEKSTFDLFGEVTHLQFNRDGHVAGVSGDYLKGEFQGLSREEIEQRFGRPGSRAIKQTKLIYFYSIPDAAGSGTYRRREVHFDDTGTVTSVVSDTFYD